MKVPTNKGACETHTVATQSSQPPTVDESPKMNLSEMKYDELKSYAKKHGVDIKKYSTKAKMMEQLTH